MKLLITSRAEKQLRQIEGVDRIVIAKNLRKLPTLKATQLVDHPRAYRVRVGDFRIIYLKRDREILIVLIGQRRDIYKTLKNLG